MRRHRDRRATPRRAESAPPRSGRPKDDDDDPTWSETALGAALTLTVTPASNRGPRFEAKTTAVHAAALARFGVVNASARARAASAATCIQADCTPPSCQPGVWLSAALAK